MPRPGPRPYECVRRAWHSDRHQPMRGSIIHKIFRAVHERHSTATKKNKEWQLKLPIVVLKAEEIMYSKANSEAEYMDPETLWDRANDAIDVIIRRDESTETGQLLPPCVEAALVMGCVAERTSRSQRNSKPRNYLSPRTQEPCPTPPKVFNQSSNEHNSNSQSPHSSSQPTFGRPGHVDLVSLASESNKSITPNINNFSASPSSMSQILHVESNTPLSMGTVYPLYDGINFQPKVTQSGFHEPQSNVIVGKPIYPSIMESAEVNCLQSLFPKSIDNHAQDERTFLRGGPQEECDLSLRLGQPLDHDLHLGKASASGGHNMRPSDSNERGKSKVRSTINDTDICFFRVESTNDQSRLPTSWQNSEGEGHDVESILRKRKMPFHNSVDNAQFFSQEGRTFNHFTGQMKRPGL